MKCCPLRFLLFVFSDFVSPELFWLILCSNSLRASRLLCFLFQIFTYPVSAAWPSFFLRSLLFADPVSAQCLASVFLPLVLPNPVSAQLPCSLPCFLLRQFHLCHVRVISSVVSDPVAQLSCPASPQHPNRPAQSRGPTDIAREQGPENARGGPGKHDRDRPQQIGVPQFK